MPAAPATLIDGHGRRIDYLRLSVTDRCDLRCHYCLPQGFDDYSTPADWLNFDEIERLAACFVRHGVHRLRLTGGEPLLRQRLPELVGRLKALPGLDDLSLSTNGTRLAAQAGALRRAGVDRLNVSLDSLDSQHFAAITGRDCLSDVLHGLHAAHLAGFQRIKINMVWQPTAADALPAQQLLGELEAMIAFCRERRFVLRLIERMPLGAGSGNNPTDTATGKPGQSKLLDVLFAAIRARYGLIEGIVAGGGPARYLVSPGGDFSIGFITPLSQHFCASCNRLRLTVDGQLLLCLGQDDRCDLRQLLRQGASDDALDAALVAAVQRKPERHEFNEAPGKIVRVMASSGG